MDQDKNLLEMQESEESEALTLSRLNFNFKKCPPLGFLVTQLVKDSAWSLEQLRSLLWLGFNPWSRNFRVLQMWPKDR